ncbi:hypothetical protein DPMN_136583 [Dreissena polymorpha]|uniref:Uncharacterized protein n=1 Tax=Dreissena polymorpha TaxID=45954 RepID=A0A9D4G431_DREPO|nr:hypothetical protein DPMN_136583 [Dreissena polymorpha]
MLCIKNALKSVDLRRSQYNVTEQYPAEVLERRKALVGHMTAARRDEKRAVLIRDKLSIDEESCWLQLKMSDLLKYKDNMVTLGAAALHRQLISVEDGPELQLEPCPFAGLKLEISRSVNERRTTNATRERI